MVLGLKDKKQFLQISAIAFVLALFPQILRIALISSFFGLLLSYVNALVIYAIAPVLIFTVFYFIGKKPNHTLELRPIMLALLIGFILSFFVGSIIYSAMWELTLTVVNFLENLLQSIIVFFVAYFLAALAGLSIGQNKQKKLTPISEPELS